ncbi:hypothetical protein [Bacillus solitudinis]|uniref:hypothetical protein n=1 Tax=Bacillus solitudinis TaxID=2014074 RepID=UPI000C231B39|nr:hypothetical protein [Bacillus solitudinis]
MRYNEPFDDDKMTEVQFQAMVSVTIYKLEKNNASKYLTKFLKDVYTEMKKLEISSKDSLSKDDDSLFDSAAANLKIPSGAYKAFYEQAETQMEVMLRKRT